MDFKIIFVVVLSLSTTLTMSSDVSRIVTANEKFGLKAYNILAKKDGNLIMSPFSAHVALSMAYQGAAGVTADAFKSVLNVEGPEATAESYHALLAGVNAVKDVTLKTANKIFVKEGYGLKSPFKDTLTEKFSASAEEVNFEENEKTAKTINVWVEDKTNNKIKDLIKPDDLDSFTRLVLVNAIYFKGNWAKKFQKDLTREQTFYQLDGSEIKCDMMHINGKFKYADNTELNAKVLEMPYTGEAMSMLFILPNERNGLPELEKKISNFDFSNYDKKMYKVEVDVDIPRFKIESTIDMKDMLTEMGLGNIFSRKANFSNIAANNEELAVSKVIQKAFIEVNEEGAEAAAATGLVMMVQLSALLNKPMFVANHPFLIAIVHKQARINFFKNRQNMILFIGRVAIPA